MTAFPGTGDSNSYWIIKSAHEDEPRRSGLAVKCDDVIRLQHLNTAKNLHSHEHRAPMNRDNEVSAYAVLHEGRWAFGDEADNWVVECVSGKGDWKRFEQVRFRHEERGAYLSASSSLRFGDPIPNQLQVSAAGRRSSNAIWRTNEGFFLAPRKTQDQ